MADALAARWQLQAGRRRGPLPGRLLARARWAGEGHRLATGVTALAVASLPLMRPHGPFNSAPVDLPIVLAVLSTLLWAGATNTRLRLPYGVAVGVMVFAGALSSLGNEMPRHGLVAIIQDVILLVWAAAIANLVRSPAALRMILAAWTVGAVAAAGFMDLAYLSGHAGLAGVAASEGPRAALAFDDPNMAASYFVASLMVVLAVRLPRNRWLRLLAVLALLVAVALTGSNGGLLTLGVCVAVVMVAAIGHRFGSMPAVASALVAVVVGTLAVFVFNFAAVQAMAHESSIPLVRGSIGRSAQSASERSLLLNEAAALYQRNVVLGIGTNTYKQALARTQAPYVHEAHNDYLATLVERGLVGFTGLLLLIGAVGVRGAGLLRGALQPAFAAVLPSRVPLVAAVIGFATSAAFYQVLHFRHVWVLLGLLAGVYLWGRQPAR